MIIRYTIELHINYMIKALYNAVSITSINMIKIAILLNKLDDLMMDWYRKRMLNL